MPALIAALIALFLGMGLLVGGLLSLPFWGVGVGLELFAAFLLAQWRSSRITSPRVLVTVLQGSWDERAATLNWTINRVALDKVTHARVVAFVGLLPGLAFMALQAPAFFEQRVSPPSD